MSELLISDLDRTILDTDGFSEAVVKDILDIDDDARANILDMLEQPDTADIMDIIAVYGVELQDIEDIVQRMQDDYVYPDFNSFHASFKGDLMVLTTALSTDWQWFKLHHARLTQHADVVTTNKGKHLLATAVGTLGSVGLAEYFPDQTFERVHLVDDKLSQLEPLFGDERFRLTLMQRPGEKYTITDCERKSALHRAEANDLTIAASFDEVQTA